MRGLIILVAAFALTVAGASLAGNNNNSQDHTCQGGHNCNTGTTDNGGDNFNFKTNVHNTNKNTNKNTNTVTITNTISEGSSGNPLSEPLELRSQTSNESDSDLNVNVSGDNYEAPDMGRMPGMPASVVVDACSSGASASVPGMGATFGQGSPVCLYLAMSNAAFAQGNRELASKYMAKAESELFRRRIVSRWLSWIPLVGPLF